MEMLKSVIADIAIVAVLATFIDIFLPQTKGKYGVKLVFGLYFLAILLNPVVSLFSDSDFAQLDFRELAINGQQGDNQELDYSVLETAATSLGTEIKGKLDAIYEGSQFQVAVDMDKDEIKQVNIEVVGVSAGGERVTQDEIKELLAADYGVKKSKTKVVFS